MGENSSFRFQGSSFRFQLNFRDSFPTQQQAHVLQVEMGSPKPETEKHPLIMPESQKVMMSHPAFRYPAMPG